MQAESCALDWRLRRWATDGALLSWSVLLCSLIHVFVLECMPTDPCECRYLRVRRATLGIKLHMASILP